MRDSETAARSVGIDLRTYKLFIFAASAFIAGIGGSLLAQQRLVFGRFDFDPFTSLRWFTVVIVAGVGSIGGAVIAGFLFVMLDRFLPVHGTADVIIALAALLLGYIPGGSIMGALRWLAGIARAPAGLMRTFAEGRGGGGPAPPAPPSDEPELVLSPYARELLQQGSGR
jgi:branched-chain amino acid transport system permease protein